MPLGAPQNFAAQAIYYGELSLTWDALAGAIYFNIYRRLTSVGGGYTFIGRSTTTSILAVGLEANTSYQFVAVGVDVDGIQGAPTPPLAAVTIGPGDAPPRPPTGLVVVPALHSNVVSWGSGADDVFAWTLKRSTTSGGPYTTIPGVEMIGEPTYTDTELVSETTYYYVVQAFNLQWSADSTAAAGTPREIITRVVRSLLRRRR
jgi:hypothetical protein